MVVFVSTIGLEAFFRLHKVFRVRGWIAFTIKIIKLSNHTDYFVWVWIGKKILAKK